MNEYTSKHKLNIDTTDEMPDPRDVEREAMRAAGLLPEDEDAPQDETDDYRHEQRQRSARQSDDDRDVDIYLSDDEIDEMNDERARELDRRERELERREQELRRREQRQREEHPARRREQPRGQEHRQEAPVRKKVSEHKESERKVPERKARKRRHPIRNFLLILLLILAAVIGWFLYKVNGMIEGGLSLSDIESYISDEVKSSQESGSMAGYTNIALFGLDSTEGDLSAGNNRSDIMIIASINNSTGDIKLVSLYRDTYLDIGGGNYQKANAAYAYGGPEQAVQMLNTNLDLNISDYVVTGFEGIASVIDAVGGIEIDVAEEEISHLNNYQTTMSQETGLEYKEVTQAGPQTLTGLQATAYCRIRYTDGGDFKRTERQKEVLSKTFDKLKASGPLTMISVANTVMDKVRTSLSMTEIAALAVKATTYSISDTTGVPTESLRTVGYIGDQSCVIPIHLSDNVVWLHQYLFNDTSYAVSSTVQEISNTISTRSGY